MALALAWIAAPTASRADTIVYNNISSTIFGAQLNGGATSATGNTALLADDITFLGGYAGFKVTSFTLNVASNAATETATLTAEFFLADGANGGPGTLLSSATMMATFANGLTVETFSSANLFTVPASGKIWAGFYFTGISGSLNSLNNLGSYAYSGPTVGSSTTNLFVGTGTATTGANPVGSQVANPGGQGGNLGIAFAVPEPSSVLCMALGGAGLAGLIARRRKKA